MNVLPSGQYRFITKAAYDKLKGNKGSKAKTRSTSKGSVKKTGKRRARRIPIIPSLTALGIGTHLAKFPGDIKDKGREASRIFSGFDIKDGKWHPELMMYGTVPIVASLFISRLISKFRLQPDWPYIRL